MPVFLLVTTNASVSLGMPVFLLVTTNARTTNASVSLGMPVFLKVTTNYTQQPPMRSSVTLQLVGQLRKQIPNF